MACDIAEPESMTRERDGGKREEKRNGMVAEGEMRHTEGS